MSTRIIDQRDGQFGLYETSTDQIWAINCTEEEIIETLVEQAKQRVEVETRNAFEFARRNNSVVGMPIEEALSYHRGHSNPEFEAIVQEVKRKNS